MSLNQQMSRFLAADMFAVVGASTDRSKYGNKVLRHYVENGRKVVPINHKEPQVEGLDAKKSLSELNEPAKYSVSIITPPAVTEKVIDEALGLGITNLWCQPGSENAEAIQKAKDRGANVISGGPCVLVTKL
eukprot:Clim_evm19s149 gene=Clim_evmTU19s149